VGKLWAIADENGNVATAVATAKTFAVSSMSISNLSLLSSRMKMFVFQMLCGVRAKRNSKIDRIFRSGGESPIEQSVLLCNSMYYRWKLHEYSGRSPNNRNPRSSDGRRT
jgi:hypothetical protein